MSALSVQRNSFDIVSYDESPDLLTLQQSNVQRYPFLLQSISTEQTKNNLDLHTHSRFDILFAFPLSTLELKNDNRLYLDGCYCPQNDFLAELDKQWENNKVPQDDVDIPFKGGWFIYLSYELSGHIEPLLQQSLFHHPQHEILATAIRIPAAIVYDKKKLKTYVIVETAYNYLLDELRKDFTSIHRFDISTKKSKQKVNVIHEEISDTFINNVEKIKSYIYDGDIFQANISRLWQLETPIGMTASGLYMQLRKTNPAPFAALAYLNETAIISSSPERLVRVKHGWIETRPIAGTYPRHKDLQKDQLLSKQLLSHPKETAEHIMLIDLERNDLGKLCEPGTIQVNKLMLLESYQYVHHIVSNIIGKLHQHITPADVIRAVFPGGTITGCPKIRCMEIIAELEKTTRGPYTGSIGYLNRDGSMDLNILIRTFEFTKNSIKFRTGAGIVYDSEAISELEETRSKARGMINSLQNI